MYCHGNLTSIELQHSPPLLGEGGAIASSYLGAKNTSIPILKATVGLCYVINLEY